MIEKTCTPYEGPRQGDLLTRETAARLQLTEGDGDLRRVVVISHDCDLANDAEAAVEVIVAETVVRGPRPDPQLTYAKNPRRLHLPYIMGPDTEPLVLELQHQQKRILPKPDFLGGAVRDQAAALVSEAKRVLKQ